MAWKIEFRAKAEKQLSGLAKRDAARIVSFVEERLATHENPLVLVVEIGHRREVYR